MKLKDEEKQKVLNEFDALSKCRHGLNAVSCKQCLAKKWQDTPTLSGKTIGELIDTFVEMQKIDEIDLEEYAGKNVTKKTVNRIAKITGVVIVGGFILYQGGKIIARLISRKENKE